jgi:mandelamide amidase
MGQYSKRATVASLIIWAGTYSAPALAEKPIDLDGLTAAQAAADLCAGKISSKALTSAALARAKASPNFNMFITLDEAGAIKAALAFDTSRKRGSCKALGGVPVVVKDNIEVAGLPTSAGTPALKAYVPRKDAPVVEKLRAAGAIIIGKTNVHEQPSHLRLQRRVRPARVRTQRYDMTKSPAARRPNGCRDRRGSSRWSRH